MLTSIKVATSIEHGNLVDDETARLMAAKNVFAVPPLATFEILTRHREKYGLSPVAVSKISSVREAGFESLEKFKQHSVKMGYGTDFLGESHVYQSEELSLRARVLSPWDIIESTTPVSEGHAEQLIPIMPSVDAMFGLGTRQIFSCTRH